MDKYPKVIYDVVNYSLIKDEILKLLYNSTNCEITDYEQNKLNLNKMFNIYELKLCERRLTSMKFTKNINFLVNDYTTILDLKKKLILETDGIFSNIELYTGISQSTKKLLENHILLGDIDTVTTFKIIYIKVKLSPPKKN